MSLYQTILLSGFDVVMLNIMAHSLLNEKLKAKLFNLLSIVFFSILTGISGFYISNLVVAFFVNAIFICVMFRVIYRRNIMNTFFLYIGSMVILSCIQLLIAFFISTVSGNIANSFIYGIVAQIVGLVISLIVYQYISFSEIYQFIVKKNRVVEYLLLNSFMILFFIILYWYIDIEGIIGNMLSILVLSIVIIFVNFVILRNGLRNQFENQELKIYKTYMPVIEQLMEDIRARQHEFDNHLQALRMMKKIDDQSRNDNIDELIDKYCVNIVEKNKWNYLIKLNNKMLAGFLYSKIMEAEKEGINIEVVLNTYFIDTEMKDYELIEAAGIIINNAFEAVRGERDKQVVIKISKQKDMNVIEIKNRHSYLSDEIILNMFKRGYSTKAETGRGYGLNNLKNLINKYKGEIQVYNEGEEENFVIIRIIFR